MHQARSYCKNKGLFNKGFHPDQIIVLILYYVQEEKFQAPTVILLKQKSGHTERADKKGIHRLRAESRTHNTH